ncbi:MAG: ATP synthase F1 subunit delta [Acidimicrobiia bacterium]|jgi:F-type H+-transporting ATPase subunit delta
MADERIQGYARGIFEMAKGENALERVESELLAVARAVESSNELRSTLTDPQLTLDRKQAIVDELIGGRASPLTVSAVQMVVSQGRASDLPDIAMGVASAAAASRNKAVAEIRSAVALDTETVERLAASLERATGKEIDVKVVVDPSVIGGIVSRVGDTVIDGSIARRFDEARQAVKSR